MSYEPTNWKTGDVVTSEKLNKLEEGVAEASSGGSAGGAYVVEVRKIFNEDDDDYEYKCAGKYSELLAAHDAGKLIICKLIDVEKSTTSYINLTARTPWPSGGSAYEVFRFDMSDPGANAANIQSVWLTAGTSIDSVKAYYYAKQLS